MKWSFGVLFFFSALWGAKCWAQEEEREVVESQEVTGGEGGRQKGEIGEGMKGRSGDMEEETLWTSGLVNLVEKDMLTEVQEERKSDVLARRYNPLSCIIVSS